MRRPLVAALIAVHSLPALASTPAAWAAETRAARAACVAEAGLVGPRVTPIAAFDDRSALDAMLLTGLLHRGPPITVTMLCLYDRRTHRATTVEAQGWPSVRR